MPLLLYLPTPLGNEVPQLVPCPGVADPKVLPPGALYVPREMGFGATKPPPPKPLEPYEPAVPPTLLEPNEPAVLPVGFTNPPAEPPVLPPTVCLG